MQISLHVQPNVKYLLFYDWHVQPIVNQIYNEIPTYRLSCLTYI